MKLRLIAMILIAAEICNAQTAAYKSFLDQFSAASIPVAGGGTWVDPDTYLSFISFEATNTHSVIDTGLGTNAVGNHHNSTFTPNVATGPTLSSSGSGTNRIAHFSTGQYFATTNMFGWEASAMSATTLTVSCWVKFDTVAGNQSLMDLWNAGNYLLYLGHDAANSKLTFAIKQSGGTAIFSPDSGVCASNIWIHVAGIADGSKVRLYTNGIECGTGTTYDGTLKTASLHQYMGALSTFLSYQLLGYLDRVAYCGYPRSLSNITNEIINTHPDL